MYVEDTQYGGIVHCDFSANMEVKQMNLSSEATKLLNTPNAGGSSVLSEVMSFEVLQKCFNAKLLKNEKEVVYVPKYCGPKSADYVCDVFGANLGVSVTRAMKYWGGQFTEKDAQYLLTKKLRGVLQSSKNSLENWQKQVLHVWSANRDITNTLTNVYYQLPEELTSNTVVLVTTTTAASNFLYSSTGSTDLIVGDQHQRQWSNA